MKTLKEFLDEGMVDTIQKGVKRHKDAIEKKKIKNRKAVPYAALAAQHEPEGEVLDERRGVKEGVEEKKRELVRKHSQAALKDYPEYKRTFSQASRDYVTKIQAEKRRKEEGKRGRYDERVPTKEELQVKEGKIADALKREVLRLKARDRELGLLPGGKDVVDLDVERQRRRKKVDEGKLTSVKATTYGMPHKEREEFINKERKRLGVKPKPEKKVDEEVGVASSTVAMKKAREEAKLKAKEEAAVKKAKKVSEAKVDQVDYVISQLKKVSEARIQVESATHPEKFSMKKFAQGLEKKHGKGTVLSKYTSKPKPPTEAEKREYAAHKAKIAGEDRRDDLEKASDGRYSRKYSNRGSD